jgi:hypothetical protein
MPGRIPATEGKKYTHLVANPQQNPLQIHWANEKKGNP